MQVHRNDMITTRNSNHVGHELRCNWRPAFVLLVHARIGEARNDSCNPASGSSLARGDKNEELHKTIIRIPTPTLDDEDILFADGLADFHAGLTVGELADNAGREGDVKPV